MKRLKVWLASLVFLLLITPALSQNVYKWKDDKGNIYFTDDYGKIPENFRGKIQKEYHFEKPTPEQIREEELREEKAKDEKLKEEKLRQEKEKKEKEEKKCGRCEVTSFAQIKKGSGIGVIRRGTFVEFAETCAEITIQNNDCEVETILRQNIVAKLPDGKTINPMGNFYIKLQPGQSYKGIVCFGKLFPTIEDIHIY